MATMSGIWAHPRDAQPVVFATKAHKRFVPIDENKLYRTEKHFCKTLVETDQIKKVQAMENRRLPQTVNADVLLTDELKQLKRQEFVDRKRRQQLRNDCEELRQLAEHLRLAAITKDLEEHMREINRSRQLANHVKLQGLQRAEAERQQQLAMEQEKELRKKKKQEELRKTLISQVEERQKCRQGQYVQTLAEREVRMAIQQQIEEEDKELQLELQRLKIKKRDDIIQFIEEKRKYEALQKAKLNEDTLKAFEIQLEEAKHREEMEKARLEAIRKQQEISSRIGQQVLEVENRKRQRDNVLLDLLQAEYKAKDDERYRQQLQQEQLERQRTRQELERYRAEAYERHLEAVRKKKEQAVDKDSFSIDIHACGDNEILIRQQRKEHGALLLSMIEENNRKRAEEAAENIRFFNLKAKSDAERQALIEEERLRMLSSVPTEVLKYLPKQVLSESDRKYFNVQKQ
ncbi:meiosis-specific nuclear structural protein 1 [Drosophila navojoa]|nr:meiosis-specific nuclear structural protein 1 [Drosophila navojoa]